MGKLAEGDGGEELFEAERDHRIWFLLFVLIAGALWVQWLGRGAWAEVMSEDGSASILAMQLLPLAVAAVAAGWSHPAPRLVLFPVSFLPGMALMTDAEWELVGEPAALGVAALLFGLYLVVAAGRAPTKNLVVTPRRPVEKGVSSEEDRAFRRFVAVRLLIAVLVFVVTSVALFVDPEVTSALAAVDESSQGNHHRIFVTVFVYFAAMIIVYLGAVLPILNWEYDRRRSPMPVRQRRLLQSPSRLVRRIALWLVILFMVMSAVIWMYFGG